MILTAVFLVSFSTLAFEVLLARVFSIGQWNHLSFMVISIALLGFAASGTFLSIIDIRNIRWQKIFYSKASTVNIIVLYSSTVILSFIALNNLPLDYFRLPLEPIQSLYLLAAYLFLALPFFLSGLIVAMAYALMPERTGFIYFASMGGSACGAILPALLLPVFGEGKLIILSALIPLIVLLSYATHLRRRPRAFNEQRLKYIGPLSLGSSVIILALFLILYSEASIIQVEPSPYKALSQVLKFPNTRITQTFTSIRGKTDHVLSPHLRFAPGLSLRYAEPLAGQDVTCFIIFAPKRTCIFQNSHYHTADII
jgi:hypothetical protein